MKRIVFLDYVRVFACFLVMLVHASENFYGAPGMTDMAGPQSFLNNETDRLWVSLYDGFSRMSVPLFMIVSAFLLAPVPETESMNVFYRRRFMRIIPPLAVFMVLYSTLTVLCGQLDTTMSLNDISRLLVNYPSLAGHFWFMYPLIGIYLFLPIISPWLRNATARQELFFILLFLLSTCMPFLRRWFGELWGECFWNEYHMLWYFSGYLGYVVLAHYIHKHLSWTRNERLLRGSALAVVGAALTIWSFYIQAEPGVLLETPEIEIGWAFCTINCVMLTAGTFIVFTAINWRESAIVTEMSKLSYGMYLMHIFWLGMWVDVFKNIYPLATPAAIPAIAICTFATCYLCTKAMSYLPYAKYIVGTASNVKKILPAAKNA